MKKSNLFILILISILSLTTIYAVTGIIQTDIFYDGSTLNPVTNVQETLYTCSDSNCLTQGNLIHNLNTGSSNSITIEYPYNPSSTQLNPDYYSHFSFAQCYLPKEYKEWVWGSGESVQYDYYMNKVESCYSPIDSFSITNENYANEPVIINMKALLGADVHSAFTDKELNWFPAGYEDYYSVETKVTLKIYDLNDNVVYEDHEDLNILMDTSEDVEFDWAPTIEGNYRAVVETDVTDCQCESSFKQSAEKEFSVWPDRPENECYTIVNDLEANPSFPIQGEVMTFTFNKISNYADNNFDKTPIPTKVTYEIAEGGNIVFSDNQVLNSNPNSDDYKEFSFNWTPTKGGDFQARVIGFAKSSLCEGKTNPNDISILNFFVNGIPKHDVKFVTKDSVTGQALSGVKVELGTQTGTTNSVGEVEFNVNEGNYNWEVSKTDYFAKTGSVNANSDKIINVVLVSIPPVIQKYDLTFVVKNSVTNQLLENVEIDLGLFQDITDSQGKIIFDNLIEGNYNWEASKSDYNTKTGSILLDEDKTVTIYLEEIIIVVENYDIIFSVEKCGTDQLLENVKIKFDLLQGFTDCNGELTFEDILEGVYDWEASKDGYYTKDGDINLDSNETVYMCLTEIPFENSITLVNLIYPKGGETLKGTETILWNATNNLGHLLLISIDYSLDDGLIWSGIANNESNDGKYSWNTKNYKDDDYVLRICAKDTITNEIVCDQSNEFKVKQKKSNGGSIGGGFIELLNYEDCIPEWDCGSWNICEDNFQSRNCEDLNQCHEEFGKPLESRFCESSSIGLEETKPNFLWLWILIGIVLLIVLIFLISLLG